MNAWERFRTDARTYRNQHPEQRDGQAHFVALHWAYPDLTAEIRSDPELDPFYRDDRLPAFLEFVRERLEDQP